MRKPKGYYSNRLYNHEEVIRYVEEKRAYYKSWRKTDSGKSRIKAAQKRYLQTAKGKEAKARAQLKWRTKILSR